MSGNGRRFSLILGKIATVPGVRSWRSWIEIGPSSAPRGSSDIQNTADAAGRAKRSSFVSFAGSCVNGVSPGFSGPARRSTP